MEDGLLQWLAKRNKIGAFKIGASMTFAGLNYLAILIAAVVAWLAGAAWYMSLGKIW